MTKSPMTLQDLRRKIYVKAKAEPSWRFWGLFVHVCKLETLHAAYALAKANAGAPGVLDDLRADLVAAPGKPRLSGACRCRPRKRSTGSTGNTKSSAPATSAVTDAA